MRIQQVFVLICLLAWTLNIAISAPLKGTSSSTTDRAKANTVKTAPAAVVKINNGLVYLDYTIYRHGRHTDPPEKLLDMVKAYPRANHFRMVYEMDGLRTVYHNNVFFDRKKKILRFHGKYWEGKERPYYQFYEVTEDKLRRVILLSNKTLHTLGFEGMGPDTFFFLLAKVGCPVKDLRTKKFVSYEEIAGT
jgi:hypothetical protein